MSTDLEQRLRAEMEQVVVRPRPGLVNEAYRSYRGKRRMRRAVIATGTAVAIAAGTAVGVVAATAPPATIPAETTAYIASHVSSAFATTNRIMYTSTTTSFGPPANSHFVTDLWEYGTQIRQLDDSGNGQPMSETWVQAGHGKPTSIWIDYQQRSWERFTIAPSGPAPRLSLCGAPGALLLAPSATPADWKAVIDSGLRCGLFHVAGHQRVDGVDAIKLTGSADKSGIMLWASSGGGSITIWLDSHTYLPVQLAGTEATNGPKPATALIHFRWLPPTRANLAQLTGTIPPGFHRTYPR
jgi:hypothetical protein